ncbi:hypothetical protein HanXRQr2_Chr16g0746721 [Helianthus annuus]|uniref:Uncharacterized protein n=1 Tax=Helianthus annuus TaxID=4232 RepID=A0A251RPX9_HELAN|nr:hypothetical protein HanXRQr2_Chr16g0746721 [Helianthus annuus]KAJ0437997.1 hypothetical protein HanHA300_Chr16g0608881 [Helianthus annuus]KAJ0442605.1 hypothetical protein HanIR_Chr16g0811321 [Helianthus annuus]KAJ0460326.1 hypothetical protein HanHA89_Chr16g0659521 [Helianthus annuus]KAJ0640769.1 hypothetical protein HanLR1_Chr16g0619511 [Helianthus annuus]
MVSLSEQQRWWFGRWQPISSKLVVLWESIGVVTDMGVEVERKDRRIGDRRAAPPLTVAAVELNGGRPATELRRRLWWSSVASPRSISVQQERG